jgi:hypothetical protein
MTFLPPNPDIRRGHEATITRRQIEELLDAGSGVVQQGQQEIIALPVRCGAIDLGEQVGELSFRQVAKDGARGFLDRDRENSLTRDGEARLAAENIPHETVNRRQAGIAGAHRIVASRLQMVQKLRDQVRGEILEPKSIDGSVRRVAREPQQQLERVSIGCDGVGADVPLGCEIADEESRHQHRKIWVRHDGLLSVMR